MSKESIPEENSSNSRGSEFISSSQDNSSVYNNNMETHSHYIFDKDCVKPEHTFEPIFNNNLDNFHFTSNDNYLSSPQTCLTQEITQTNIYLKEKDANYTIDPNPNFSISKKSKNEVSPEQKSRNAQASQLSRIRRRQREQRLDEDNRNLKQTVQQLEEHNHHLEQEHSRRQYQNRLIRQSLNNLNHSEQPNIFNSSIHDLYHQRQTLDHQMLILQRQINQLELEISDLQLSEPSSNILKKSPSSE